MADLSRHKIEVERLQNAASDAALAFGTRANSEKGELNSELADARADATSARKQLEAAMEEAKKTQRLLHEKDLQIQELIEYVALYASATLQCQSFSIIMKRFFCLSLCFLSQRYSF